MHISTKYCVTLHSLQESLYSDGPRNQINNYKKENKLTSEWLTEWSVLGSDASLRPLVMTCSWRAFIIMSCIEEEEAGNSSVLLSATPTWVADVVERSPFAVMVIQYDVSWWMLLSYLIGWLKGDTSTVMEKVAN